MSRNAKSTTLAWVDPDDAPKWTKEVFDAAEIKVGDVVIRPETGKIGPGGKVIPISPGRPKLDRPKRQVTLRLDQDVLDRFRSAGPGWQSRIIAALRLAVGV